MWTVFRFALSGADHRAYRDAYELLGRAGFVRVGDAHPRESGTVLPAAVLADVGQDPAAITAVLFEVLAAARLRPVAVTGCPVAPQPVTARQRESAAP
jgi:hypothetical protein